MAIAGCMRCSNCGINWPHEYRQCPECEENTRWGSGDPIDQSEVNHRLFEVFYAKREKELAELVDACEPATADLKAID